MGRVGGGGLSEGKEDGEKDVWVAAKMQPGVLVEFNPSNAVLLCDLGQVTCFLRFLSQAKEHITVE